MIMKSKFGWTSVKKKYEDLTTEEAEFVDKFYEQRKDKLSENLKKQHERVKEILRVRRENK